MSLKLRRKKESVVPPLEGGAYFGICVGIINAGHQYSEKFKKSSEKVIFIFEIPSERVTIDGKSKPRWISEKYTFSLNQKAKLCKVLIAWRGRNFTDAELAEFDLTSMIGVPATLQVVQSERNGNTYANIAGITELPKGVPAPRAENEYLIYDVSEPDDTVFAKLPEWIQNFIRASDEYADSHVGEEILDIDTETGEVIEGSGAVPF